MTDLALTSLLGDRCVTGGFFVGPLLVCGPLGMDRCSETLLLLPISVENQHEGKKRLRSHRCRCRAKEYHGTMLKYMLPSSNSLT